MEDRRGICECEGQPALPVRHAGYRDEIQDSQDGVREQGYRRRKADVREGPRHNGQGPRDASVRQGRQLPRGMAGRVRPPPRNYMQKQTTHINQVEFDGIHHNNQMESFNGATIRHREKVVRGLKKEDSPIIVGLQVYHNHVRSHFGLPDQSTPDEATGIRIEGNNKILTLIQAAVKSAA